MKMKIILDKTKNKVSYYAFLLTSHFILYLIIMMVYLILFIYFFADPILCEGGSTDVIISSNDSIQETIESLKTSLQSSTTKFNEVYRQYNNCCSLYDEGLKRTDVSFNIINALDFAKSHALRHSVEDMAEIRIIEEKIRLMDIEFKSSISKKWFEFQ
jgi:hypothetical protein